jgi:hypothetical protein
MLRRSIPRGPRACALVAAAGFFVGTALLSTATAENPDPHPGAPLPVREQNLDANGWIAVHEQGEADVNITNGSLQVSGAVSVSNFPAAQDVNVTGGAVGASIAPATAAVVLEVTTDAGEEETFLFADVNATAIALWDSSLAGSNDPEANISVLSPLNSGGTVVYMSFEDGLDGFDIRTFPQPVPVSGIHVYCANESVHCTLRIAVIGS